MKYICLPETYTDKQSGEEKTTWNRIGVLIEKGDKQYVKLYHMPGAFCTVFEAKKKTTTQEEGVDF